MFIQSSLVRVQFLWLPILLFGCGGQGSTVVECNDPPCEDISLPIPNPVPPFTLLDEPLEKHGGITIRSDGLWALSAFDRQNGELRIGRGMAPNDLSWSTIDTTMSAGGDHYSMVLFDEEGLLHVLYYDGDSTDLKHATVPDSGDPNIETVDANGDVGSYLSVAADASGGLHVSYFDKSNQQAKYAHRDDEGRWTLEVIAPPPGSDCKDPPCSPESAQYGLFTSIGVKAGMPLVAYYHQGEGNLVLASRGNDGWTTAIVDGIDPETGADTGDIGAWPSLRVDSKGNTSIAYFEKNLGSLRFASSSQGKIKVQIIDTGTSLDVGTGASFNRIVGSHAQLVGMPTGEPAIYYLDSSRIQILRAKRSGGTWSISTIPTPEPSGPSLKAIITPDEKVALIFEQWLWEKEADIETLNRRLAIWLD